MPFSYLSSYVILLLQSYGLLLAWFVVEYLTQDTIVKISETTSLGVKGSPV